VLSIDSDMVCAKKIIKEEKDKIVIENFSGVQDVPLLMSHENIMT
jgi:hypothetical protein